MQISNKYILNQQNQHTPEDSLIVHMIFEELLDKVPQITGKPLLCYSCGASVANGETIKNTNTLGLHFICEFCGTINKIDENQFNLLKALKQNVVEYIEDIPVKIDMTDKIVASIDISGSMENAPIEAVKNSLINTIMDLSVNSPDTGFALITFSDWVSLYDSDGNEIIRMEGQDIYDEKKFIETFKSIPYNFEKIGVTYLKWIDVIKKLKVFSKTALGPAVLGAVSLLKESGRVILLTDGLSNLGIGNLAGYSPSGKKGKFYRFLGEKCRDKGIVIEVVGVSTSNTSISLDKIGEMARLTGGDIYMVDLKEINRTFDALSQTDILGKNVRIKLYIPEQMKLRDTTGDIVLSKEKSALMASLGSVNPDRKFCVAFDTMYGLSVNNPLPIQCEVDYIGTDNKKRKRIYKKKFMVTNNEKFVIENLQSDITDVYYRQKTAELGRTGYEQEGIKQLKNYIERLQTFQEIASPEAKKRFSRSSTIMADDLEDMVNLQKEKSKDVKYSMYQARVSYGKTAAMRAESRKFRQTRTAEPDEL